MLNLSKEELQEATEKLAVLFNGTMQTTVQEAYQSCRAIGTENELYEKLAKKFNNASDYYNSDVLPALQSVSAALEELTNLAIKVENVTGSASDTVKTGDLGKADTSSFDAAAVL